MRLWWTLCGVSLLLLVAAMRSVAATAVDRRANVLVSADVLHPLCWDGDAQRMAERSCCVQHVVAGDTSACFDAFFTPERCCENASAFRARAIAFKERLLACEREAAHRVHVPAGFSLHAITAASHFGRLVWCVAQEATVAFDVFAGEGGSAWLLADAMLGRREGGRQDNRSGSRVVTFERSGAEGTLVADNVGDFRTLLATLGEFDLGVLKAGEVSLAELEERLAANRGAMLAPLTVFHGEPYPSQVLIEDSLKSMQVVSKYKMEPSHLEVLCRALRPELVVLDPTSPIVREWLVVEEACQPSFVAIFNTNLPNGAGWIRDKLMFQGRWAEVLTGISVDTGILRAWPVGEILAGRRWSLLARDADGAVHPMQPS